MTNRGLLDRLCVLYEGDENMNINAVAECW